ncbi:DNA RNA-binding protein kin17 [Chrysochromulina tobinii]|uniref:DNA RNA-binding protein kin17 n=1 Tax=Chrysochromulina tobinii TaxID=1460289 RepID=A0A0M0JGF0_9EUKA|nr:DNA RNA-binding protein kin17 [Chrysochromulina tobinii]|eukprot:KOO25681.1 DNA RNA-binding protein kin17 [Chrysochromulina sp. CCMP291]
MPKDGFLAPKAIANRMKAKGLQKLRWYCQMCQKQCRDENGFKCHTMSESHLRQMEMFSENSTKFMDEFSREFEQGMIEIIKRKARSQRKNANELYRDYISDKQHFHMNATIWETLTDFVMYLGRKGMCEVDETEKGWFVMYIDRDPETLARMEARAKRERDALDSEEKHQRDIQRQVKQARLAGELDDELAQPTELQRAHDAERIRIVGLVVKCTDKRLQGGAYYKQKGCVEKLVDRYTAHVRMTTSGDLLKLDQEVLETVIPAAGGRVLVVNGAWRGQRGSLEAIDEARFCVRVQLDSGQLLEAVEYEDVCKLALSA